MQKEEAKGGIRYFYKHSSISAKVSITLKGVSDSNGSLGINMCQLQPEYKETIARLCERHPHLAIPQYNVNIVRGRMDPASISAAPPARKPERRPEVHGPGKHAMLEVDANCFRRNHLSECSLFAVVQLYNNGKPLEPAMRTPRLRSLSFFEHIVFPIAYQDLALDATIAVTLYDMNKPPERGLVGGTCINLFNQQKCLRQGHFALYLHKGCKGDPTLHTTTVGLIDDPLLKEKNKIYSYIDRQNSRHAQPIPWLDSLAYQSITKMLHKTDHDASYGTLDVMLPLYEHPVVWKEQKYARKEIFLSFSKFERRLQARVDPAQPPITLVYDPLIVSRKKEEFLSPSNPIATKYYLLSRVVDDVVAKELRPSAEEKQELDELIAKPDFNRLNDREKSLVWRYRYFLQSHKEAIIKLLMSVQWDIEKEVKEVMTLLNNWAPIELEQAIIMLSGLFPMNSIVEGKKPPPEKAVIAAVRRKGLEYLRRMKLEDLDLIVLQLVQAYRYEDHAKSELKEFLIECASKRANLASDIMWALKVEAENKSNEHMQPQYKLFFLEFMEAMDRPANKATRKVLDTQQKLRSDLLELNIMIKQSKAKAEMKTKQLKELIGKGGRKELTKIDLVSLPTNPQIFVNGIDSDNCHVFKSKTYPMKIAFTVAQPPSPTEFRPNYYVLFKEGDDMRQDQLILQMITLMDGLLKKVSVDLMFSIYRVVAASPKDGFADFVTESSTISGIKEKYHDEIVEFLQKTAAEKHIDHKTVVETFIKSCAGYCAVTYLLGIGDRHLENLMVCSDGRFFHIDFGFILGNDPKPFPPPIRISQQMVTAMGGKKSSQYEGFCKKCVDAFLYLRKHCKLIVNLFYLMKDAGLQDLPARDSSACLNKLYERFMPDKNEQDAEAALLAFCIVVLS